MITINRLRIRVTAAAICVVCLFGCAEKTEKQRGTPPDTFPDGLYEEVSIFSVLADPSQYSERHIEVQGYLHVHDGNWRLFPTPDHARLYDLASTIQLNLILDPESECNGNWAKVKGVTKPYSGVYVEFNPEMIHYVSLAEKSHDCFAIESFKNNKGKVFILEEGDEIPIIEPDKDAAQPSNFR